MNGGLYRRGRPRSRAAEEPPAPSHNNHTPSPISVRFTWHGHSNFVLSELNNLRSNETLSDINLVVNDVNIPAHKAVLAASSPYFCAMFTSAYAEGSQSSVEIHGVTLEALEALVNYFYTSEITLSTSNVQELLAASSMLQITLVTSACSEFMKRHLGVSNCLGVSSFADMLSCSDLKKMADEFTLRNFTEVVTSEEFLKLPLEHVLNIFSADDLNVPSEESVFNAVVTWIKYDPAKRDKYLAELLKKVRLSLLPPSFICDHARKVGMVQQSPVAMSMLMDALECHLMPDRRAGLSSEQTRPRAPPNRTQAILVVGGMGRREITGTPSIEQYLPSSRQWRILSQMVSGSWGAGLVTTDMEKGDEVYLVGGSNESSRLSTLGRYNVGGDQWTSLPEMSVARNGVGVVCTDGLLYAIGGFDGMAPLNSAESYDPRTNQWTPLPNMASKRFGLGACVCNGKIYAVGGSDGNNLSSVECYTIANRTWTHLSPMSVARKFPGVETLSGCVYVIGGGADSNQKHCSVEKYMPSLNQWVSVAPLNTPRSGLCTVVLEGYIFALGGHDGKAPLSSVEKYDPLLNEWSLQPNMTLARDCASASVVRVELGGQGRVNSPSILGGSSNRSSPDNRTTSPIIT